MAGFTFCQQFSDWSVLFVFVSILKQRRSFGDPAKGNEFECTDIIGFKMSHIIAEAPPPPYPLPWNI